jgi:ElaB/YqjD/DUF883 family membrane-anchored ribosome-binding protein
MPNNNPQSPPQPSARTAGSSKIADRIEQTAEQTTKLADKLGHTAEEQASAAIQRLRDVGDQARSGLEEQRAQIAKRVRRVGEVLRSGSGLLESDDPFAANLLNIAVDRIGSVADYVEELSPGALSDDVQTLARRRPAIFYGGAFLVGLGLARFVKSTAAASSGGASGDTYAARRSAFASPPTRAGETESGEGAGEEPTTRKEATRSAGESERKEGTQP